jgi:hypothetical protein
MATRNTLLKGKGKSGNIMTIAIHVCLVPKLRKHGALSLNQSFSKCAGLPCKKEYILFSVRTKSYFRVVVSACLPICQCELPKPIALVREAMYEGRDTHVHSNSLFLYIRNVKKRRRSILYIFIT